MLPQNMESILRVPYVVIGMHRFCDYVINVHFHSASNFLFNNFVNYALINVVDVLQTKWDNLVTT